MKNIFRHIKALMFEHDYVSVPNLGAFILNYQPAQVIDGKLEPPSRLVSFNELLRQDDGLLITHLSKHSFISIADAKKLVESFVSQLKKDLQTGDEKYLEGIGYLYLSVEGSICFRPLEQCNYFGDSFGLEGVYTSQVSAPAQSIFIDRYMTFGDIESIEIPVDTSNYRKLNVRRTLAYTIPFVLLIFLAGISRYLDTPSTIFDEPKALSSLNPADYIARPSLNEAPILQDDDMRVEEPAVVEQTNEVTKATHIVVVGVFSKEQNAYLLDKLLKEHELVSHIDDWKNCKRVYVDVTEGKVKEVQDKLEQLINEKGVVLKK